MSLHHLAQQRAAAGRPVRVGLIGAGKFGSMFLNQVPTMPGVEDTDAREAPSAHERTGSRDAVDADTHDEPSMETSGTVDAVDATDPATADADERDEVGADDSDDTGDES